MGRSVGSGPRRARRPRHAAGGRRRRPGVLRGSTRPGQSVDAGTCRASWAVAGGPSVTASGGGSRAGSCWGLPAVGGLPAGPTGGKAGSHPPGWAGSSGAAGRPARARPRMTYMAHIPRPRPGSAARVRAIAAGCGSRHARARRLGSGLSRLVAAPVTPGLGGSGPGYRGWLRLPSRPGSAVGSGLSRLVAAPVTPGLGGSGPGYRGWLRLPSRPGSAAWVRAIAAGCGSRHARARRLGSGLSRLVAAPVTPGLGGYTMEPGPRSSSPVPPPSGTKAPPARAGRPRRWQRGRDRTTSPRQGVPGALACRLPV